MVRVHEADVPRKSRNAKQETSQTMLFPVQTDATKEIAGRIEMLNKQIEEAENDIAGYESRMTHARSDIAGRKKLIASYEALIVIP